MADDNDKSEGAAPEKPAVTFKTEGEFLSAVDKKAASRERKAAEAARTEILSKLGVESVDDLDSLTERLKSSQQQQSEAEKLKGEAAKLAKKLADADKAIAELAGFKVSTLKQRALMSHATKVADPEALDAFIAPKLVVGDDGTVTGPEGKDVGEMVEELIASKPYLKAPGYKAGAGTKPNAQKAEPGTSGNGEPPKTVGAAIMAELASRGALPGLGP